MASNLALWDIQEERVVDYPRADDEPVVQLDTERYYVLRVVKEPKPVAQPGFRVAQVKEVRLRDLEWIWGWEMQPEPPTGPDYQSFYNALLISEIYSAVASQEPTAGAARALAVFVSAIQDALNGRKNHDAMQGAIWLLLGNLQLNPEHIAELQMLMALHGLDNYSLEPLQ